MHIRNLTQKLDISYVLKDSWHLPMHKHTHFELQYIMRGKGQHVINDQCYNYGKGDVFIMVPDDHHFFIFEERSAICFIKFHEGFFGEILQDADFKQLLSGFSSPYRKASLSVDTRRQVIQLIDTIMNEDRKKTTYSNIIVKSSLTLVLALMAKNSGQLLARPKGERIQSILSYIDAHITERHLLTTGKIADAFFISKGYFNQYFHKATGSSYKKYVNEYSLNLIAQQLIHSDKTLSQLAGEFGYSDESHLSNAFKGHFHQTPSAFKKERQRR